MGGVLGLGVKGRSFGGGRLGGSARQGLRPSDDVEPRGSSVGSNWEWAGTLERRSGRKWLDGLFWREFASCCEVNLAGGLGGGRTESSQGAVWWFKLGIGRYFGEALGKEVVGRLDLEGVCFLL